MRRPNGGKPPRENIQAKPGAPEEAGNAVDPDDSIADLHNEHRDENQGVTGYTIDAICEILSLPIDAVASDRLDCEGREGEDKRERDVDPAPPPGKCGSVLRERCADREYPGEQEQDCGCERGRAKPERLLHFGGHVRIVYIAARGTQFAGIPTSPVKTEICWFVAAVKH